MEHGAVEQRAVNSTARSSTAQSSSTPTCPGQTIQTAPANLTQAQINGRVNSLLSKMTVDEKFGQLEMAGPNGAKDRPVT